MENNLSQNSSPISDQEKLFEEVTIDNRKVYMCLIPDCGRECRFKSEIDRHLAVHSKQRPHVCTFPQCGKTFKRADALSNHIRSHNSNLSFICPMPACGNQFATKAALKYHLLKHKGQKKFRCRISGCNRAFITLAQLKQHEKAYFYHQKYNQNSSPNDLNKDDDIEENENTTEETSQVKEEAVGSESQNSTYKADSVNHSEAYKKTKVETDKGQIKTLINTFTNSNLLNINQQLSLFKPTYNPTPIDTFGANSIDPKLASMLSTIMEENKQLKSRLNNVMTMPFYGLPNQTFPPQYNLNMALLNFPQNGLELNRAALTAFKYPF